MRYARAELGAVFPNNGALCRIVEIESTISKECYTTALFDRERTVKGPVDR